MPGPAFTWSTYEVLVAPPEGRLRAAAEAPDVGAAPQAVVVELPDLTDWPQPLDKARILLESAAEVEHALMVQYLYAAYSLKDAREVTDPLGGSLREVRTPRSRRSRAHTLFWPAPTACSASAIPRATNWYRRAACGPSCRCTGRSHVWQASRQASSRGSSSVKRCARSPLAGTQR